MYCSFSDLHDCYYTQLQTTMEPLKICVKKSTGIAGPSTVKLSHYMMTTNPRGLVLIINNIKFVSNEERLGANHDENNLKVLFEEIGFKVLDPIRNAKHTVSLIKL